MSEPKITPGTPKSPNPTGQSAPRSPSRSRVDLASLIVIVITVLAVGAAAYFVHRGSSLKSQLTQAQAEAETQRARLQSQLDAASTKAREATDQLAQLQSQADQARAEATSAKASAETASKQIADLQSQLDQAKREAADAKAAVEKLSAEAARLKAGLQGEASVTTPAPVTAAQAEAAALVKTDTSGLAKMPLGIEFRKAPLGDGNALHLQNTSTVALSLTVRFSNATGSKEVPVQLDPDTAKDLGWLGAWVLAPGDKVEIRSPGYETIAKTAP